MESIEKQFNKYQLPNGSSSKPIKRELPIDAVDKLADELVAEYVNPEFRQWYCGVVYQFGFAKVEEWRGKARDGKEPAKLFSLYVKQTRIYHSTKVVPDEDK